MAASPARARDAPPLRSLYFGGGTPSLTPPALLAGLIADVRARYGLADGAEVTLEMDPGTFGAERLDAFLSAGVNRVSLGVQSFDERLLEACGRAHSLADVHVAITTLLEAAASPSSPLRSVSIDLIGGLPHQTRDTWRRSLDAAVASGAHHVSVYDLQVEPRTAFGRWYTPGEPPLPSEEEAAQMYRDAVGTLGATYDHYEVSSYARCGHQSVHNRHYWRNAPFWGFGLGATSHVDGVRLARPRKMGEYEQFVDGLEAPNGWAGAQAARGEHEPRGSLAALQTELMLALRTDDGVDLSALKTAYPGGVGEAAATACADAAGEMPPGWIEMRGDVLRLTDPEGLLFSNDAISTIFARIDERVGERIIVGARDGAAAHESLA